MRLPQVLLVVSLGLSWISAQQSSPIFQVQLDAPVLSPPQLDTRFATPLLQKLTGVPRISVLASVVRSEGVVLLVRGDSSLAVRETLGHLAQEGGMTLRSITPHPPPITPKRHIVISLDRSRMRELNFSRRQIARSIREATDTRVAGSVQENSSRIPVRIHVAHSISSLSRLVIGHRAGRSILLESVSSRIEETTPSASGPLPHDLRMLVIQADSADALQKHLVHLSRILSADSGEKDSLNHFPSIRPHLDIRFLPRPVAQHNLNIHDLSEQIGDAIRPDLRVSHDPPIDLHFPPLEISDLEKILLHSSGEKSFPLSKIAKISRIREPEAILRLKSSRFSGCLPLPLISQEDLEKALQSTAGLEVTRLSEGPVLEFLRHLLRSPNR